MHPITLRIKNVKTRGKFHKFAISQVIGNLRYISILLLITLFIQFFTYLGEFETKGILLLNYIDIVIVSILLYFLGHKFPRLLDHGPTIAVVSRSIVIMIFHANYHYNVGAHQEINRNQFNGSVIFIYITAGMSFVTNFRLFVMTTTPIFLVFYSINLYLLTVWPMRD